jgi:hypothetical protein
LPPHLRLAARVESVRQRLAVIPTVVIVPDGASYVEAIARWTLAGRYPVLIDDGTWAAQQDIARFVRAFRPDAVVRWRAPPEAPAAGDAGSRRAAVENAVARAWGAADAAALPERWKRLELVPAGVVVAWPDDPAWTAALAVAAGRGQPIAWIAPPPGGVDGEATSDSLDSFSGAVERACEATGYSWRSIGDDLEAVTLCLNMPARVAMTAGGRTERLATTDVVGRPVTGTRTPRWAWAGQVFGGPSQAAYRAMCALFLQPRRAWLFDGYEKAAPFTAFDVRAAAAELERVGIRAVTNAEGPQGAEAFRRFACGRARGSNEGDEAAARGGTDADLIAVTTMGYYESFDLRPGRCTAGDVPLLSRPAIVYFVHSWSAMVPASRRSVAGRWLEHGAYAYLGAVDEPYLQAFLPTPLFARRLAGQVPWGAAVRYDESPPWKVAVIGDPLLTVGPPAPRSAARLPLEGASDVHASMVEALKAERFADAMRDLALLAEDEKAARLMASLLHDRPDQVTAEVARAGVLACYFAGRFDTVVAAYARLAMLAESAPMLRDVIWHTVWPTISTLREREEAMLRASLRPEQMGRDAAELAAAIRLTQGEAAMRAFANEVRGRLPDDESRRQFEAELVK